MDFDWKGAKLILPEPDVPVLVKTRNGKYGISKVYICKGNYRVMTYTGKLADELECAMKRLYHPHYIE